MPRQVPLHDVHASLGARFTGFSGYEMPVMYDSIVAEHEAVRGSVGLFDISHMGNLRIGGDAPGTLSRATVADARQLPEGRGRYTVALREDGTILDDTIFSRTDEGWHLVPNAGRDEAVADHLRDQGGEVDNVTDETCIFALQGPDAEAVMAELSPDATQLSPFGCLHDQVAGVECLLSRTGYTGEDGFEAICPAAGAEAVWEALAADATPCGLGARDTLRLEMGFCLAGHEFAGGRSPLEAGLAWLVDWDHEFVGRKALETQRDEGVDERLVGLVLEEGIPRQGYAVQRDGDRIGEVTSGTKGPTVGKGIALAYVGTDHAEAGTGVEVVARGSPKPATVVEPPFVER